MSACNELGITPKEVLIRAVNYPMNHILERYSKEQALPWESAKEHERELKRYLGLCSLHPSKHYGMAGPIDNLWHTFLLFTREYQDFCSSVAGRFIHHVPSAKAQEDRKAYLDFLQDYEDVFGEPAPAHLWPRLGRRTEPGPDCGGCSSCANCAAGAETPEAAANCGGCGSCSGCGDR